MNTPTFAARRGARRSSPALVVAVTIFAMIAYFFPGFSAPAEASHVEPQLREGNPTCGDFGEWEEAKVEPVSSGTYSFGELEVTITVRNTDDGPVFDWSSNTDIDAVFVKGGPNGNLYEYPSETTSDSGLHAPLNEDGSGKYYGLSHISFCYELAEEQPATGDISLAKAATGDAPQDATFTFDVDCDDDAFDQTGIELSDGGSQTVVDDAPTGTQCTITETDDADADTTTFTVDGANPVESDSVTVTVGDATTVAVLATNAFVTVANEVIERPGIELEKSADPVIAEVGETITYTYRITNTGETTLSEIVLVDDKLGVILLPDVVLEPGDSTEVQETHVVTEADAEAGEIVNVAVVRAESPEGEEVTDEARAQVEVVEVEGVTVTRPEAPQAAPEAPEEPEAAPETEARELARTGASTLWMLVLAILAMLGGVGFLRVADRREGGLA